MKLKHFAACAALIAAATTANAESLYLHIQTANGDWQVLDLEKVDRLTFTDGNMIVADANNQTVATFPTSNVANMQVNDSQTDITEFPSAGVETAVAATEATFTIDGRSIAVLADGALTITAIDGRTAVVIPAVKAGQSVDVSALAAGTYIINLGAHTQKVAIR